MDETLSDSEAFDHQQRLSFDEAEFAINSPEQEREIQDLEFFMQGIHTKLHKKDKSGGVYQSAGSDSDGSTDEDAYKRRRKKKLKKK